MDAVEIRQLAHTEESFWWHRGRQRIIKRMLDRYVPVGSSILDVGCGPGGTTQSYCRGADVLGIDASRESVSFAHGRGIAVALMDATRLAVRPASFDAVVALDVIEHVDDEQALRSMFTALRPGGTLIVTVPAYQFLWSSHDDAVGHLRRYTRGSLLRVAGCAGFEVVLGAYAMSSILPAAMAVRLAERVRKPRGEPAAKFVKLPDFVNATLERVVGLGPAPVPFLPVPFGLSIVLVARRPAQTAGVEARTEEREPHNAAVR